MEENLVFAEISSIKLLIQILICVLIGWYSAFRYRNTNDYKKSIITFIPLVIISFILFTLMGIPVIINIGLCICSFICMSLFSNYYFYH